VTYSKYIYKIGCVLTETYNTSLSNCTTNFCQ